MKTSLKIALTLSILLATAAVAALVIRSRTPDAEPAFGLGSAAVVPPPATATTPASSPASPDLAGGRSASTTGTLLAGRKIDLNGSSYLLGEGGELLLGDEWAGSWSADGARLSFSPVDPDGGGAVVTTEVTGRLVDGELVLD